MKDTANSVRDKGEGRSDTPDLQRRFVRRTIKEALHRATGRGGVAIKKISEASGMEPARIYEHRNLGRGNVVPNAADLIAYTVVCGPDLINDMMAPFGFGGLHRITPTAADPMALHAMVAGFAAMQAEHRADLIIQAHENVREQRAGGDLATALLEFNAVLRARQREHWRLA